MNATRCSAIQVSSASNRIFRKLEKKYSQPHSVLVLFIEIKHWIKTLIWFQSLDILSKCCYVNNHEYELKNKEMHSLLKNNNTCL